MRRLVKAGLWGAGTALVVICLAIQNQGVHLAGEMTMGPCQVDTKTVNSDGTAIDIYYPVGVCTTLIMAPYPAVAFAHGFSFFGLSDGAGENSGNGVYLASWGYIAAIPTLPDDAESRIGLIVSVLDFIETENANVNSFLYQQVDPDRFAVVGHSLGGATALAVGAQDSRIKAVVALDPVYHARTLMDGEYPVWNPVDEGPNITVPTGILGAPADACNSQADYEEIYPFVGAAHKAAYHIVDASHCVFSDPGNSTCDLVCGGTADPALTQLSQKYMAAWLNYYLYLNPNNYRTLFGEEADADVNMGKIELAFYTFPHDFSATNLTEAVRLDWLGYEQPMISGYHIYRRLPEYEFSNVPYVSLDLESSFIDSEVTAGQLYGYKVQSFDPTGNLHQLSGEITAVPQPPSTKLWLPIVKKP